MTKLTIEVDVENNDGVVKYGFTKVAVDGEQVGLLQAFDFSVTTESTRPEMTAHIVQAQGYEKSVELLKRIPLLQIIETPLPTEETHVPSPHELERTETTLQITPATDVPPVAG